MSAYPYLRGDGVPIAHPLFQEEGSGLIPTSPLQLHFRETTVENACLLNKYWHSRLPDLTPFAARRGSQYVCYVAECGGGYFATAIWSEPPAANRMKDDRGTVMELRRMAIAPNAPKNTASRMLGWMIKDIQNRWPHVLRLISFQDTEVHKGTIYAAAGWVANGVTRYRPWDASTNHRGSRKPVQSTADKIRWEKIFGAAGEKA